MQGSFIHDATLSPKLFTLLETVFPGINGSAAHARSLGAAWESVSTPFIHVEDGRAVSHVGIIELPLVLMGRCVRAGTIHGVATHPAYRRHGRYRRVMEEALRYGAEHFETLVLTTEHPEYFEPFGFRHIPEHRFRTRGERSGRTIGARPLELRDPADLALLNRLLETREPVSRVVGVGSEKAVFFFNEGRRPLRYFPDLDALACLELDGALLRLYDVVAPRLPSLPALVECLPGPVEEVVLHFAPDRLGVRAVAEPYLLDHDGPSYFMVRGPFPAEGQAFTLPRSART